MFKHLAYAVFIIAAQTKVITWQGKLLLHPFTSGKLRPREVKWLVQITELTGWAQSNLVSNNQASNALRLTHPTYSHSFEHPRTLPTQPNFPSLRLCSDHSHVLSSIQLCPAPAPITPCLSGELPSPKTMFGTGCELWRQDTCICLFIICAHSSAPYRLYCLIYSNNSTLVCGLSGKNSLHTDYTKGESDVIVK